MRSQPHTHGGEFRGGMKWLWYKYVVRYWDRITGNAKLQAQYENQLDRIHGALRAGDVEKALAITVEEEWPEGMR